jgi:hypothetical protein
MSQSVVNFDDLYPNTHQREAHQQIMSFSNLHNSAFKDDAVTIDDYILDGFLQRPSQQIFHQGSTARLSTSQLPSSSRYLGKNILRGATPTLGAGI